MASPIVVACPKCQKQIKGSEELQGKKVRCKGCEHIFVFPAAAKAAPARAKAAPKEEEEDANPYGVQDAGETAARCPHCAQELDSAAAVICVNCGYNTVTRQRVGTRKVIETTPGDQFAWLLPGLLSVSLILVLIGLDLLYVFVVPIWVKDGDFEFLSHGGFKLWFVIASLFGMFFLGAFAVKRLILNPTPPERIVGDGGE